jgi:hypothetical protein
MSVWVRISVGVVIAGLSLSMAVGAPGKDKAAADAREGRTCFVSRHVDSWAAQGIDTVNVKVNQDYFRLKLAEACPEIQEADRIKLTSRAGGGTVFICVGEIAAAEVTAYSKATGPRRCLVHDMQRLTPTEVASLSKAEKP